MLNRLNERPIYRRWRQRQTPVRKRPERDFRYGWVSRQFPHERQFQQFVSHQLRLARIPFTEEYQLPGLRSRADFKVQGLLIECKVDVRTGSMNEAIGQAVLYQLASAQSVIVVVPEDVDPLPVHLEALARIGAQLWRPNDLRHCLEGG